MNDSNFYHAYLTFFVMIVTMGLWGYTFGVGATPPMQLAVISGLFPVGFYFGREVAQHERKMGGKPWYVGFKVWEWSTDSLLDFLFPVGVWVLFIVCMWFMLYFD